MLGSFELLFQILKSKNQKKLFSTRNKRLKMSLSAKKGVFTLFCSYKLTKKSQLSSKRLTGEHKEAMLFFGLYEIGHFDSS